MTKATKAQYIAQLEEHLSWLLMLRKPEGLECE